MHTDVAWIANP